MKLNLTPQNKQEELILNYLQNNASETLADKINNGTPFEKDGNPLLNKKTLSGFMKYACDEARKLAEKALIPPALTTLPFTVGRYIILKKKALKEHFTRLTARNINLLRKRW